MFAGTLACMALGWALRGPIEPAVKQRQNDVRWTSCVAQLQESERSRQFAWVVAAGVAAESDRVVGAVLDSVMGTGWRNNAGPMYEHLTSMKGYAKRAEGADDE
jgi:hypothetical protein